MVRMRELRFIIDRQTNSSGENMVIFSPVSLCLYFILSTCVAPAAAAQLGLSCE